MSRHNELGKNGEILALEFLQQKGHQIVELNFRCGHKEVDIISVDKGILVFTEIKTRSTYKMGYPEEAVGLKKQSFLEEAAEQYCLDHPQYTAMRFDVLSLLVTAGKIREALHFEDAFY